MVCIVPLEAVRWALVGAATLTSGTFIMLSLRVPIHEAAGAKVRGERGAGEDQGREVRCSTVSARCRVQASLCPCTRLADWLAGWLPFLPAGRLRHILPLTPHALHPVLPRSPPLLALSGLRAGSAPVHSHDLRARRAGPGAEALLLPIQSAGHVEVNGACWPSVHRPDDDAVLDALVLDALVLASGRVSGAA